MLYALGVYNDFGWMLEFEKFRIHICQPRLNHWDVWEISVKDLLEWAGKVAAPAARKTLDHRADFKAGEWCRFCKIRATCRVRADYVLELQHKDSGLDDLDAEPRVVSQLTADEIAAALANRGNVEKWYSDLSHYALNEIKAGRPIGEWKIVATNAHRRWKKDEEEKLVMVLAERDLDDAQVYERKLKSPAKIEKMLKKDKAVIAEFIEKPPGKPTLAPGDDPREAISADALSGFSDLDADEQEKDFG
jgi:hypothetical protein